MNSCLGAADSVACVSSLSISFWSRKSGTVLESSAMGAGLLDHEVGKINLLHDALAEGLVVGGDELLAQHVLGAGLLEIGERERRKHAERDIGQARLVGVEEALEIDVRAGDEERGLEVA